jgi:hypothetical protein
MKRGLTMRRLVIVGATMVMIGCLAVLMAGALYGWHKELPDWADASLAVLFGGGCLLCFLGLVGPLWRDG